jgi:hypothetical protein
MLWWEPELIGQTKPDRPATNISQFSNTLEIAHPHDCEIAFSVQRHSVTNTKSGDCQCTCFSIVPALIISIFIFIVAVCLRAY